MIYFSAIKTLNCHTKIAVNRVYFLRFCTKHLAWFSKYGTELIAALSSTNATKINLVLPEHYSRFPSFSCGGIFRLQSCFALFSLVASPLLPLLAENNNER